MTRSAGICLQPEGPLPGDRAWVTGVQWALSLLLIWSSFLFSPIALGAEGNTALPANLPQPYTASYALFRGGKLAGRGTMSLLSLGQGRYQCTSSSEATKGFAGFLGGQVSETSTWEMTAQGPRSLSYEYDQKVAFSKRKRHSLFDYASGRVSGENKGKAWDLRLRDGAMDRLLTNYLMIGDVASGQQAMSYLVADRGRYKEYDFVRVGSESLDTDLGAMETIRVERQHDDPERKTISWHAPEYAYLPIRIIHIDDGEELQLDIQSISFQ